MYRNDYVKGKRKKEAGENVGEELKLLPSIDHLLLIFKNRLAEALPYVLSFVHQLRLAS